MAEAEAGEVMVAVDLGSLLHIKQHFKESATIALSGVIKRLTIGNYRIRTKEEEIILLRMKLVVHQWRLC